MILIVMSHGEKNILPWQGGINGHFCRWREVIIPSIAPISFNWPCGFWQKHVWIGCDDPQCPDLKNS